MTPSPIELMEDEATWFWSESANETESELEGGGKSAVEEASLDQALPRSEEAVFIPSCLKNITRIKVKIGCGAVMEKGQFLL